MSQLQAFIQHYWPDARNGLDYELVTDPQGQEKVAVWADSLGDSPQSEEVSSWDPERPELSSRKQTSMAALEQGRQRDSLVRMLSNPINKAAALQRLKRLEGKTVGTQLDGFRELLTQMFESMPG